MSRVLGRHHNDLTAQAERAHRLLEERRPRSARLEEPKMTLRGDDRQRDTGEPRPRSDVNHRAGRDVSEQGRRAQRIVDVPLSKT
jgi:hypothetical protein